MQSRMNVKEVLLPYGFLLEDNRKRPTQRLQRVLLPYGFLLEDNILPSLAETASVLLPYGFLLEDNSMVYQYVKPQTLPIIITNKTAN